MDSPLSSGTRLGRYEIRSKIGEGGMGEVYLAQDTKLDRKVALKILPAEVASHRDRMSRFVQEAKAASALNHPNIITIHEIDQTDSVSFIATEFIDGETLRERMRNASLKLGELLDVAAQIASALSAAHAAGIVHRDIKPENIMLRRDGIAKVLDFGLAKLTERLPPESVDTEAPTSFKTDPGTVVGTAIYMSPEQARGMPVDARTDIFSFGVVVYEMVAGRLPFEGSNTNEILASILSDKEPSPLARYAREVPPELERIVSKALRKDREERYQTVKDLLLDLKRLKHQLEFEIELERSRPPRAEAGASTSQVGKPAVQVLSPRASTNGEFIAATSPGAVPISSVGYIASGIKQHKRGAAITLTILVLVSLTAFFYLNRQPPLTEKDTVLLADFVNTTGDSTFDGSTLKQALAVQLRQTPFLNLFPEESVRETLRYMGRHEDEHITPQVGREICRRRGLKALVVGTIASLGRNYAITLEAINGQTGETIAGQQIEAEGKEQVLKSLGQAALDLRKQLGESLSTLQKYNAPIEQATTSSLEALTVYSKGLEQMYSGDYKEALPLFNRAVELDPNFAEAYVWLSWTHANFGDGAKAADFAAKAYGLRDRVTELEKLHIDEIYHLFATGNFEKQKEADEVIKRLYPNDWLAPASLGLGYLGIGQLEQALTEFHEAIRANPNESHLYMNASAILIRLNRFDEARATIKDARARKLEHLVYRLNLFRIAFAQGDATDTQQQLESIRKVDGEALALTVEASAAIFSGRWRKAQELYNRAAALSGNPSSYRTNAALAGALFGFCQPASDDIKQALTISRINSPARIIYVPVLANGSLCGDASEAQKLADEQMRRYPNSTLLNVYSEPIIRAATALQRDRADQAVEILNAAIPYEGGWAEFWPDYLRGQAYLRLRRGNEATAEFQKILDHRGWDPASPMYPLAYLGLARALSLTGDVAGSRKSYQDFFAIWKDADADLPILSESKKEYEKLK
jgi:serine/threonine protein kinase/Flp pilus assembly protein TadD